MNNRQWYNELDVTSMTDSEFEEAVGEIGADTKVYSDSPKTFSVTKPIVAHTNVGLLFENVTIKRSIAFIFESWWISTEQNGLGWPEVTSMLETAYPNLSQAFLKKMPQKDGSYHFEGDIIMLQDNCYLEGLILDCDADSPYPTSPGMHPSQVSLKGNNIVCQNVQVLNVEGADPTMGPFGQGLYQSVDTCFVVSGKRCYLIDCIANRTTYSHHVVAQGESECFAINVTAEGGHGNTTGQLPIPDPNWENEKNGQPAINLYHDKHPSSPEQHYGSNGELGSGWQIWPLTQDGFRTYGTTSKFRCINCQAINTRAGFQIWHESAGNSTSQLVECFVSGSTAGSYQCSDAVDIDHCYGEEYSGPGLVIRNNNASINGLWLSNQRSTSSYFYNNGAITGPNLQHYTNTQNEYASAGIYPSSGDIFIDMDGAHSGNIIKNIDVRPEQEFAITILAKDKVTTANIPFQGAVRDTPTGQSPKIHVIELSGSQEEQTVEICELQQCPVSTYPNTDKIGCS